MQMKNDATESGIDRICPMIRHIGYNCGTATGRLLKRLIVVALRRVVVAFSAILTLALTSCANVPQEVVDLSYTMGEDLAAVHDSYKKLIHQHFDDLRAQRLNYLDNVWTPAYVSAWIDDGHLVNLASGLEVFSEEENDFVKPTRGREQEELLSSVRMWSEAAIGEIDKKKKQLLAPLDDDEKALTDSVDDAFARLLRGNAIITTHLNSLRKVQGAQADILKALNLKDLGEKINKELADASDRAQRDLTAVQNADQKLLNFKNELQQNKTRLKDTAEKLQH